VSNYGDYENEIYGAGLIGVTPDLPMDYAELERRAEHALPDTVLSYVAGGSGDEHTQRANVEAFQHWGLIPRMLAGATERDLSVELWGARWPAPLFFAPIGVIAMCGQDGHGDLETAQASARTGVPYFSSTLSTSSLEDIRVQAGDTPAFFQLYYPDDRDLVQSFVHRAEAAGYAGIVITLDTWIFGWRPRDLSRSSFPFLRGHCLTNYLTDPVFREKCGVDPARLDADPRSAAQYWHEIFGHSVTWEDVDWFRSITKLPIILKGIAHPDDARRAADSGVDGIYCSNHGGRQANGGLPSLDCLPDVVAASGDVPVLFDSGIRSGADVVKALAMGASAVGVGRPYAWGVALGGSRGAEHVARSLLAEADLIMAVDGYKSLKELTPDALRPTR
jgi:lactate 2-monooxygenase